MTRLEIHRLLTNTLVGLRRNDGVFQMIPQTAVLRQTDTVMIRLKPIPSTVRTAPSIISLEVLLPPCIAYGQASFLQAVCSTQQLCFLPAFMTSVWLGYFFLPVVWILILPERRSTKNWTARNLFRNQECNFTSVWSVVHIRATCQNENKLHSKFTLLEFKHIA